MTKPRVVIVSLHFAEYATNLALALTRQCDVLLVIYRANIENEIGQNWHEFFEGKNISVLVVDQPKSLKYVFVNTYKLLSAIKGFRPNVVHYQEGLRDEMAFLLPFIFKTPLVLTVHDPATHSGVDSLRFRFSRYRLYRYVIRRFAAKAITHGDKLSTELEEICPWLKGHTKTIPHGPLGMRGDMGFSDLPKEMNLLFFGRIHEYKGLRFFVDAVIQLREEGFPVVGVVAGRGGDLDHYRKKMDEAGFFQILESFIPAGDVPGLFQSSRVVVLPYTDGTQSGVAALALGFGRPVVASSVGSIPELVREGKNGLLVSPRNTSELVDAIRSILTNDELWSSLSRGAIELSEGELSWGSVAKMTTHVYSSTLK